MKLADILPFFTMKDPARVVQCLNSLRKVACVLSVHGNFSPIGMHKKPAERKLSLTPGCVGKKAK